jgi:tetratricopeptide (TPR) repeat protein
MMSNDSKNLDEAFSLRRTNPELSIELCDRYLFKHPDDPEGLYSRSEAWRHLGNHENALADVNRMIEVDPTGAGYSIRADLFRDKGDYKNAALDLTRARELDEEQWKTSLDPIARADCYARLGRLDEALADCVHIPDDWWMPEFDGLPGGNKQEIIDEIKRRALAARNSTRS